MVMYCQTCGTDMMGGCDCEYRDFATPISAIRVRASGETTDPWTARKFSRYTAEITFGGETVDIPLCFREAQEGRLDNPRPTRRFLNNLNRNKWEVVEETDDTAVFEIPNPYYCGKLVRVPKKNCFMLIAYAVDLTPDESNRDCGPGGRAVLVFSTEAGEALVNDYNDHFAPSGAGWQSRPYDSRVDDDRHPRDWVYSDYTESDDVADSARSKRVRADDRPDATA